jgi:hypothetical protein
MAGPAGHSFSCLKCFSQVILVDKANLAFTDYDLQFPGHFRPLVLFWRSPNS